MRTTRQQASVWWPRAQLRRDVDFDLERRVSWLELFFDLVFVVVLSRLAHDLAVHPDADHVLDFVLSVADQVADYSRELGIDDNLLGTIEQFAVADRALAAVDFERNGYTAKWSDERSESLHTHAHLEHGWDAADDDPDLAERRRELDDLAPDTLGHHVHRFYRARGFNYPGTPGSAPPLLAQHDWVHVVAEYGTKVEAELEVFAFIARVNDVPRGFSLLAMVISLSRLATSRPTPVSSKRSPGSSPATVWPTASATQCGAGRSATASTPSPTWTSCRSTGSHSPTSL